MIKVGISQGDINGIGWEVIMKTFQDPEMLEICTPVIFGSGKTASYHRKALGLEEFNFTAIKDADQIAHKRVNVVNVYEEEAAIEMGKPSVEAGKYALRSLEATTDALKNGKVDVMVTAPLNKHTIQSDAFQFKGHTEYLQAKFQTNDSLMLLCSDNIRVGLVTGHIPLAYVASSITEEKIVSKIRLMKKALLSDFGIRKPKIAVLGLNPHAGDNGTLGNEEKNIIIPAIEKCKQENTVVMGPYSADGFFGSGSHHKFDGILAMYHDQGLAPFKTISFNQGVNFTAGLPIVRTSPDHGTAYELAGKNLASETSFRKAVYTAIDIFRKRNEYKEISANPLAFNALKPERS